MSGPLPPELRLLRALDELRDAMAAVLVARAVPEPPADGLLTLTTAARRLGLSRSTVTRWADDGRIRTVGRSRSRRVPVAELERIKAGPDRDSGPALPMEGTSHARRSTS